MVRRTVTVRSRALAVLVVLGLAAGSFVGVASSASAADPLTVAITGSPSLGSTLSVSANRTLSDSATYVWSVSPVDTGDNPVVSNEKTYTPVASHKNQTLKVTVTDAAETVTSTGVLITGGNVQTGQPSVEAGDSFGITGTFFAPNQPYTVIFNAANTEVTTDANGSFAATIPVPSATKAATLTISVQSAVAGKITSTTIVVVPPASNPTMSATAPRIDGAVKVGTGIQVVLGSWTAGTTFKYQWQRDGHSIAGATSPRYAVVAADKGHLIRIRVIGTSDAATVTAYSESTRAAAATFTSTPRITIKGTLKRGHKLRAVVTGSFSPTATTTFAWYVNGIKVAGTKSTIIVKRTWKHKHVTAHLTGSRSGYTTVTKSYTTAKKVAK